MSFRLGQQLRRLGKQRAGAASGSERREERRRNLKVEGLEARQLLATVPTIPTPTFKNIPIPGEFFGNTGITGGPDGNVWFTEDLSPRIGRLTPTGVITEYPPPSGLGAARITPGPSTDKSSLWFTQGSEIGRVGLDGSFTEYPIPTKPPVGGATTGNVLAYSLGGSAQGIAAGPDGALWFTMTFGSQIGHLTTAGVFTFYTIPTAFNDPQEIVAGADNALYFSEFFGKLGRIDTKGNITEYPLPAGSSASNALALGTDGNIWFTDQGNNSIGRLTTKGLITEYKIPTSGATPSGIASGPDGALWFLESQVNQVGRITTDGKTITEYTLPTTPPAPGSTTGTGTPIFQSPRFITSNLDGNLYFTNSSANIGEVVLAPVVSTTITVTGQAITATAGIPFTATVASFTDTNPAAAVGNYTATISWGDGTTSGGTIAPEVGSTKKFDITGGHTYATGNITGYTVTIVVTDKTTDTIGTGTGSAVVGKAPVQASSVPFFPTEGRPFTGVVATFTDPDPNVTAATFTATIDWGEGNSLNPQLSLGTVRAAGTANTYNVYGTHVYEQVGPSNVAVNITGGKVPVNLTQTINVPDSALIFVNPTAPITTVEGGSFGGTVATFFDIDLGATLDKYTATLTYDDGTTSVGVISVDPTSANRFIVTPPGDSPHLFAQGGVHPVLVDVFDKGGFHASAIINFNVTAAPLNAAFVSPTVQGRTASGIVATFSSADPFLTAANFQTAIAWGDGRVTPGTVQPDASGSGFDILGSNTYVNEGSYPLTVVIARTGVAGASTVLNGQVVIPDAPLTAKPIAFTTGQQTPFSGTVATFTDADPTGTVASFGALINWGDGTLSAGTVTSDPKVPGQFDVTATKTYATAGTYKAYVLIADTGGSQALVSPTATVNPPPTYSISGGLAASSRTGPANSGSVTSNSQPTITGVGGPNLTVQLAFVPVGTANVILAGQTTTDARGNFSITVGTPLTDGTYNVVAAATDSNHNLATGPTVLGSPVIVETTPPKLTDAEFDAKANVVILSFHDNLAGLDTAALTNRATYTVARITNRGETPATIQSITLSGTTLDPVVTLHLAPVVGNRRVRFIGLQLQITGTKLTNLAGIALDGSFLSNFPTGNGQPGSDFNGQFLSSGSGLTQAIPALVNIDTRGSGAFQGFLNRHRRHR